MNTVKTLLVAILLFVGSFAFGQLSLIGYAPKVERYLPAFAKLENGIWGKVNPRKIFYNVPEGMTAEDLQDLEAGKTASVTTIRHESPFLKEDRGYRDTQWYVLRGKSVVPTSTRISLIFYTIPPFAEWYAIVLAVLLCILVMSRIAEKKAKKKLTPT